MVVAVGALVVLLWFGTPSLAQVAPPGPASRSAGETRLFFGPTGRALEPGRGYFVLHGAAVPAFQVGVTNRVSIGAGFYFLGPGAWITPKVQIVRRGYTSVSAAALHAFAPGAGQVGFAFVAATRDSVRGGATFGAGIAYNPGFGDDDAGWNASGPLVLVGGDWKISERLSFVSENYLVVADAAILLNGIRASWTRFSLDVAVIAIADSGAGIVPGPILNLSWRF